MSTKNLAWMLGIVLIGGCSFPVRQRVDDLICTPVSVDLAPDVGRKPAAPDKAGTPTSPQSNLQPAVGERKVDGAFDVMQTAAQEKKDRKWMSDRILGKMNGIPGQEAPAIDIQVDPKAKEKGVLEKYLQSLKVVADKNFRPLPPLEKEFAPQPGPDGRPLTLADLQALARTNSPLLRQAAAGWEAAKGAALQAGMYPNPQFMIGGNTQGQSGGPQYDASVTQLIKTANKLQLQQAAAEKDLKIAELAFRRAETDLIYAVRTNYFQLLVSQESIRVNRAVVALTDEMYQVMVDGFRVGEFTPYEPAQLGVFAEQSRAGLVQARNSYTLAWKNLASAMGLPAMPPTEVAGQITGPNGIPLPVYRHADLLARVLAKHTDALIAEEALGKSRYLLRTAEVTPIPDVSLSVGGWFDNTQGGPNRWVQMTSVGLTLPVWDQNRGAIRQAKGQLLQSVEGPHAVRNALTASLAEAYRRYDENKVLLEMYTKNILPKQVQAFRGALRRHDLAGIGEAAYWDVINAEQNLVTVVGSYLPLLGNMWQAVADVSNLLQTDDLFRLSGPVAEPLPDLAEMLKCCHPCSPMPSLELKTFDPNWPHAGTDVMRAPPAPPTMEKTPAMDKKQSNVAPVSPELRLEFGSPIELNTPTETIPSLNALPDANPSSNKRTGGQN